MTRQSPTAPRKHVPRYVMQIDSHMRFAPGWDDELLDALVACDSPQPVLTTYPLQYELATREVRLRQTTHLCVCIHLGLRQLRVCPCEGGLVTVRCDSHAG